MATLRERLHDRRWGAAATVALAVLLFLPSVAYDFVYDDVYVIATRELLHSLANWRDILTASWWDYALYRPLTQMAFAVEWALTDGHPALFHAVNVVSHGLVTYLVYVLALRVLGEGMGGGAVVAAAIFAVHPVHVEAVANVVGRAELLSTAFALLAVLAYDRHGRRNGSRPRWMDTALGFGTLAALLAGLASKESAFAIPGLLLMLDWFRAVEQRISLGERMRRQAPLWFATVLVASAWLLLRFAILGDVAGDFPAPGLEGLGIGSRAIAMAPIVVQYARLFFFPLQLSADYSPNAIQLQPFLTLAGVLGLLIAVGVALLAIVQRHRAPSMLFAAAWTGASLLIVANLIVPSGVVLAERTLYMASVGPCLLLGWLAVRAVRSRAVPATVLVLVVLAAGTLRSALRQPVWEQEDTLVRSILFDVPRSYRAKWIAAAIAFDRGDLPQADSLLRGAVVAFPLHTGVWESLAEVAEAQGQWVDAARYHLASYRVLSDRGFPVERYALAYATTAFLVAGMVDSAEVVVELLWDRHSGTREAKVARSDVEIARGRWEAARWLRVQVALESSRWQDWWSATDAALAGAACAPAQRSMSRVRELEPEPAIRDSLANLLVRAGC